MIYNCYDLALYISPQNLIPHPRPSIHIGIPYTTTTTKKKILTVARTTVGMVLWDMPEYLWEQVGLIYGRVHGVYSNN